MDNTLIVNLGLKSIRIIVFDEKGRQLYSDSRPVYSSLNRDKVEQNAIEWRQLLEELLHDLQNNTTLTGTISHVTSTTSSSCIFGVDSNHIPLTPVMMVSDKRSIQEADEIKQSQSYVDATKSYALQCSPSSTIPKILWWKNHKESVYDQVKYWLGAGEFLTHFFTKEVITDPLNASKSFYANNRYETELLESIGLSQNSLPKVNSIGTNLSVDTTIAIKYGFNTDCSYIITTYDAICAVIGSYDGTDHTACDVSGTVTSVRILGEVGIKPEKGSLLLSQELGLENLALYGASNNMGGGIIEWWKQAIYDTDDKDVYSSMENDAQRSSVGAKGVIFLPYLLGERAPFQSQKAKATFFGIGRYTGNEDLTRAVFESTAYVTNDLLQLSVRNGVKVNALSVSGGLARFDLINQIKADVTNLPVKVLENFESTSVGAFILLSTAIKRFATLKKAAKSVVRVRKIINPSESNSAIYKQYFTLFKNVNSSLMEAYSQHALLKSKQESLTKDIIRNL